MALKPPESVLADWQRRGLIGRREPGVYPIPGVEGRYEVELPGGDVENVTEETLSTPEYSSEIRKRLAAGVPNYPTETSASSMTVGAPIITSRQPMGDGSSDTVPGSLQKLVMGGARPQNEVTLEVPEEYRQQWEADERTSRMLRGHTAPISALPQSESLQRYAPSNLQDNLGAPSGVFPANAPTSAGNFTQVARNSGTTVGPQEDSLTAGQRALKAAYDRRLAANLARVGGLAIGRGEAPIYGALERAAEEPLEAYQMEQAQGQRATALAEAKRKADLEERGMRVKEREKPPKPGWTPEEKAYHEGILKASQDRARAALMSANRPRGGGEDVKQARADDKALQELGKALSTTQGRANLNRDNQELLNRAERLQALIVGPTGDIVNLTPQQVREAGTALANLISKGSMSLTQIEELTPTSMMGKFAQAKQHLLNEPQGAEAQAFLQNMLETAAREKTVIEQQIRRGQAQSLPAFRSLIQKDRPAVDALLRSSGLDPARLGPTGEYRFDATTPAEGADKVEVIAPNGERRRIPRSRLQAALAAGARVP